MMEEATKKKIEEASNSREWLKSQGLMQQDKDEFKSTATFQECIRIGAHFGHALGVEEGKVEIEALKEALKEFDNDDNWLIESSYIDRPIKTIGSDWIYIGVWDPRVYAGHAISGTPLPNTKPEERKSLSDFYKPNPHVTQKFKSMEEKITTLTEKLKIAVEALKGLEKEAREIVNEAHPVCGVCEPYQNLLNALSKIESMGKE